MGLCLYILLNLSCKFCCSFIGLFRPKPKVCSLFIRLIFCLLIAVPLTRLTQTYPSITQNIQPSGQPTFTILNRWPPFHKTCYISQINTLSKKICSYFRYLKKKSLNISNNIQPLDHFYRKTNKIYFSIVVYFDQHLGQGNWRKILRKNRFFEFALDRWLRGNDTYGQNVAYVKWHIINRHLLT